MGGALSTIMEAQFGHKNYFETAEVQQGQGAYDYRDIIL